MPRFLVRLVPFIPAVVWQSLVYLVSFRYGTWLNTLYVLALLNDAFGAGLDPIMLKVWNLRLRKLAHGFVYLVSAVLLMRGLGAQPAGARWARGWKASAAALGIVLAASSFDEILQLFAGDRTGSISDVVIDMVGAVAGVALYRWWDARRERRRAEIEKPLVRA